MKKIFLFSFVFLTLSLLNACKKKSDTTPAPTSTISYKVNGVTKQISHAVALKGIHFALGGSSSITESLNITIHNTVNTRYPLRGVEIGNYDQADTEDGIEMSYSTKSPDIVYFAHEGTLKITYLTDDRVKGTFEFIGISNTDVKDTTGIKVITDGVFDCEIKPLN